MTFRSGSLPREAVLSTVLFASALTAPLLADQTVQVGPATQFSPSTVTVAPGETVIWSFQAFHTSTSDTPVGPEVWDSGFLSSGTFSHTFNTPGSYPYYCQVHSSPGGTAMNGVVVVSGLGATPTPTATPTATVTPPPQPTAAPATPTAPSSPIPTLDPPRAVLLALLLAGAAAFQLAARR
jgi:plastocyanin